MVRDLKTYFRLLVDEKQNDWLSQLLYPLLSILSGVYGALTRGIQFLHERKILPRKRLPFPVISVGNLTWGGTGKTPIVEYLARRISEMHKTPLILTRGYGQDEIEQMKHHLPRAVFGVGKNRIKSAEESAKNQKISAAILDDGLQHWALERDVEIVAVNALNPFGNEKLLPRGILREPLSALNRAAIIVLTNVNLIPAEELKKTKEKIQTLVPQTFLVESYMEPLFLYRANKRKRVSLQKLQNHKVTTFCGIGTPRSFQLLLSKCQIRPTRNFEFADHHAFSDSDLEEIKRVSRSASAQEIITTEKDFYRSPETITRVLNPLILATRLRISSGEEVLTERLFRLLGVTRS